MPQLTRKITGVIISLAPRAEQLSRIEIICDEGLVGITAPRKLVCPFGPFDSVEVVVNVRGRSFFLKEIHLLKRPEALSHNLPAFTEAANLARLLRACFSHLPDHREVYAIFTRAMDNYQNCASPTVVTLKAFYKMLSCEGFPVGEGWLKTLGEDLRIKAHTLLKAPLEDLHIVEGDKILKSLILWAQKELGAHLA